MVELILIGIAFLLFPLLVALCIQFLDWLADKLDLSDEKYPDK